MERKRLSVPLSPLTDTSENANFSGRLASRERNEFSRAAPNFSRQNAERAENAPDAKTPLPQERNFPQKVTESAFRQSPKAASGAKKCSKKYDKLSWAFTSLFERNYQNSVFPVLGSLSESLKAGKIICCVI